VLAAGYINARTPHQARLQSYTRCLVLSLCLSASASASASSASLCLCLCPRSSHPLQSTSTSTSTSTNTSKSSNTTPTPLHHTPTPSPHCPVSRLPHLPALCSLHDVTTAVPRLRPARHGLHAVSVPVRRRCPAASAVTVTVAVAVAVARLAVLGSRAPLSVACVACDSRPSRSFARPLGAAWQPRLAIASSPLR
jgi:hypothetical protein